MRAPVADDTTRHEEDTVTTQLRSDDGTPITVDTTGGVDGEMCSASSGEVGTLGPENRLPKRR
jgi:hypothetical protein